jgi:hypothetical protein
MEQEMSVVNHDNVNKIGQTDCWGNRCFLAVDANSNFVVRELNIVQRTWGWLTAKASDWYGTHSSTIRQVYERFHNQTGTSNQSDQVRTIKSFGQAIGDENKPPQGRDKAQAAKTHEFLKRTFPELFTQRQPYSQFSSSSSAGLPPYTQQQPSPTTGSASSTKTSSSSVDSSQTSSTVVKKSSWYGGAGTTLNDKYK